MAIPSLATKRQIVSGLKSERKLVEANRELIARMEQKIQAKLAEIWEEPAECRKFGLALILATQSARDFDTALFSNITS